MRIDPEPGVIMQRIAVNIVVEGPSSAPFSNEMSQLVRLSAVETSHTASVFKVSVNVSQNATLVADWCNKLVADVSASFWMPWFPRQLQANPP